MVATTAMLTFITFWRAAAIVLNDLASSAYYAGGIAEQAVGKSAPWFILAVMLFSYAVRAIYVESCSMFVRGGVYRVVKEAMGGTLAKLSVSALMFDYILTGPISGVSAGQYLVGFLNEIVHYLHLGIVLPENLTAAAFAILVTLYFWWENIKGIPESSEKALRIMQLTTVMVVLLIGWCGYTLWMRGGHLPPLPTLRTSAFLPRRAGMAESQQASADDRVAGNLHRPRSLHFGHERGGIARAGVSRNRASQTAQLEESRLGHLCLQPGLHVVGLILRSNDHSGCRAQELL